jgi:hypothetical protein
MKSSLGRALIVVTTIVNLVVALPNGNIPQCAQVVGGPAVRGNHVNATLRTITNGTLADGGFSVLIDDVALNPASTRTIEPTKNYSLSVRAGTGRSFKGIFVLLSVPTGSDMSAALQPLSPYQRTPSCSGTGIAGLSHTEASLKTAFGSILSLDIARPAIFLDVTIVVNSNNAAGSNYYYQRYSLAAVAKAPVATSPVASAPKAPVAAAPTAPVAAPTKKCGLLGLEIFCPLTRCGILGKLFGLCKN